MGNRTLWGRTLAQHSVECRCPRAGLWRTRCRHGGCCGQQGLRSSGSSEGEVRDGVCCGSQCRCSCAERAAGRCLFLGGFPARLFLFLANQPVSALRRPLGCCCSATRSPLT